MPDGQEGHASHPPSLCERHPVEDKHEEEVRMSQGRANFMCKVSPRLQRGQDEARGCRKGTFEQKHSQENVSSSKEKILKTQ